MPGEVSPQAPGGPVTISVCITCKTAGDPAATTAGQRLLTDLQRVASDDTIVRPVQCLGVCKRSVTVAVSAPAGFTFVFGDLDAATASGAIADFAALYRGAAHGFVPWRARPEPLRRGLVARIPSLDWSPPDGRPPE